MAENNAAAGKRIGSAARIGFAIILFLFLSTAAIFAAEEPAYEKVIAHGGGSYKGYETTNSAEALNNAITNGFKMIELDMELSSDHKIIMLHDWDRTAMHYYGRSFPKKLSQSSFMKLSVYGQLEVLTFDKLAAILEKNPDVRIVTDTKGDNPELLAAIRDKYPDLVNRIIPQIYDYGQWQEVKDLGYKDIIFTLYAMARLDTEKLITFVKEHEIYAVTMPDYLAERGICRRLSDEGIVVYVHPVSNYEKALKFMEQGAYGIYSGTLLPEEFSGIEKDYYLTVPDADGSAVKLTDDRIDGWKDMGLHGRKPQDTVSYCLDQSFGSIDDEDLDGLKPGKHVLTVKISEDEVLKGTLTCYLWKDRGKLRVLHKKYEYRLDEVKPETDFYAAMEEETIRAEIREMLEHSLIAKEGEHSFYFNGKLENFMNGEEFLQVQKGSYGRLLLPLGTTLERLGADSVTMNGGKDISIVYNQEKSLVMANSSMIRRGFLITRLQMPVTLYLNKAMAGGEFYHCITEREYLENDGRIVILPEGAQPDEAMKKELLEAAGQLF